MLPSRNQILQYTSVLMNHKIHPTVSFEVASGENLADSSLMVGSRYDIRKMHSHDSIRLRVSQPVFPEINLQCKICCQLKPIAQFVAIADCTHELCLPCARKYVQQSMKLGNKIKCYQPSCDEELRVKKSKEQPQKNYYIYNLKKKQEVNLQRYQKSIKMLYKKCSECQKSENKQKKCQSCKKLSEQVLELPENFKACPSCNKIIQKDKGCNHMKCACDHNFCFQCSEPWGRSHICEFKIPKRTGMPLYLCTCFKSIVYILLTLIIACFILVMGISICLLSSIFFGSFMVIKIMEMISRSENIGNLLKVVLFVLVMIDIPVFVILGTVPGFFIPIINLAYPYKMMLDPNILRDMSLDFLSSLNLIQAI